MFKRHVVIVATEQETGITDLLRCHLREARLQAMGETPRVVILSGQRKPGHIEIHRQQFSPPGQQRTGLAAASRPLDHYATLAPNLLQAHHQVLSRHQSPRPARRHNLGIGKRLVSLCNGG
ncbi:hypothetical protein D3C81_1917420 [compost metagenome]